MKIRKFILVITSLILLIAPLWSADLSATIEEINGKVDVKRSGGSWVPVKVGEVLTAGDSISTGFNGKAVLVLGDTSILVANALTRLTIAELLEKEGTVTTDLFLDVGNIRTEVHSSDSVSNDFQVRNANSTASVRGTVLDVEILGDGAGMKVMAWDGMALVTDIRTGRQARVGEQKKKKKAAAAEGEGEDAAAEDEAADEGDGGEGDGGDGDSGNTDPDGGGADFGPPPEPPAEIASAPLMASGGGGMVSSMASAIAASSVTVSTKPPAPADISTGGGASASVETSVTVAAVVETVTTTTSLPATSNVSIQIVWPQ